MNIKTVVNWKIYFTLLAASVLSILAVMPYILTLQGDILRISSLSLPVIILIIVLQSIFMFAIFTFIGLKLSTHLGLQLPILESIVLKKKPDINVRSIIQTSMLLGIIAGVVIILLDLLFTQTGLENLFKEISAPIWQGFLASFYGGISEEIVMRFFFMALIIWILSKFIKGKAIENNFVMWLSIIFAAVIFGLGHLPVTMAITTITPLIILRALLLNGIGGVIFGWLYWKKGIESAMIAHFSADIMLHVCYPFLLLIFASQGIT
jgi:membrane protease YdiL (CAAX protease family)